MSTEATKSINKIYLQLWLSEPKLRQLFFKIQFVSIYILPFNNLRDIITL